MKSFLAAILLVFMGQAVQAAEPTARLGTFKDWEAYTYRENGNLVCYMLSHPIKSVGDYTRRGEAYATIAHRPSEKRLDEISLIAGYTYKTDADVSLRIGTRKFNLFSQADTAWAKDAATDHDIAAAMRAGNTMVVEGVSSRGTETTDTYSLSGATAAWRAISKACGVSP
ncbi:MAG: hypothetical protein A2018_00430 [Alphaproteobacteria bacterium GWF2_58_20]|nr:MAG: hypothetical protein A2018_00430 [Alphaproteobacteria bacterium GWF2_58_20]